MQHRKILNLKAVKQLPDVVGIDRTRLARIELGNVTPYADEVVSMSKCYNAPELCYNYCSSECPIGRLTMKEVEINSF